MQPVKSPLVEPQDGILIVVSRARIAGIHGGERAWKANLGLAPFADRSTTRPPWDARRHRDRAAQTYRPNGSIPTVREIEHFGGVQAYR